MSSLRNAIPRRPHKERSQEHSRANRGLLEKHKDYSLRARDHNEKKARLRLLRQKAADRNPDEFHFAMLSSKTKNGVKIADRGNKALSMDVVKLLKTQDQGYLRTMLQRTRKEKERVEQGVVLGKGEDSDGEAVVRTLKGGRSGKHTVFVGDEEQQKEFDAEQWFETDEKGVQTAYNRPRWVKQVIVQTEGLEAVQVPSRPKGPRELEKERMAWREERIRLKKQQREQASQQAKVEALRDRERDLAIAEKEMEMQRARMSNNAGGVNKAGVKFKVRERKR
jgi:U3 small nucleolar RNA-associated protein 11